MSAVSEGRRSLRTGTLAAATLASVGFITSTSEQGRPFVLLAVALLTWLFGRTLRSPKLRLGTQAVLIATAALLFYDLLFPRILADLEGAYPVGPFSTITDTVWLVIVLLTLFSFRQGRSLGSPWRVAIVGLAAASGIALILITPEPPIDVWRLHQEGAEIFFASGNPYADMEITPTFPADSDSSLMTGYPYTPPNLIGFSGSAALTGDSRWFSLACWIGFLGLFAGLRKRSAAATALLLFLASQPGWHIVLESAYTESLTLLLLAGAIVAWRHRETLGSLLLGVALATKQYLAVLGPMVIGARLLGVRSRVITIASAVVVVASGAFWGVSDYFDAIIGFHTRVPPQPPSVNLYGVTHMLGNPIVVPTVVGLVVSIIIGIVSARTAKTPTQLLIGAATALGVGFFLATQAFVNYWLLVGGILALAMVLAEPHEDDTMSAEVTRRDERALSAS